MNHPETYYWRCAHPACPGIVSAPWPDPRTLTDYATCPVCGRRTRACPAPIAPYVLDAQDALLAESDR